MMSTALSLPVLPHDYPTSIFYPITTAHNPHDNMHTIPSSHTDLSPDSSLQSSSDSPSHDSCITYFRHTIVSSLNEPTTYAQAAKDPRWVTAMDKELHESICHCLHTRRLFHKFGIDYQETFSPVLKMATVRAIIAVAAYKGVEVPAGHVCRLKKSLYGLKQASRQWFSKLIEFLLRQDYKQSKNVYSLNIKNLDVGIVITAVYVDDIWVTGSDLKAIVDLKATLHSEFTIKDLGSLHYFLDFEIGYTPKGIIMFHRKFAAELIQASDISTIQSQHHFVTPLPLHLKLTPDEGDVLRDAEYYRSMALHHLLAYRHRTIGQGILLKGDQALQLQAYSDSNWAACPTTRRSITGYLLTLGGSPISWKSKKQSTISRSSVEAEYRAMTRVSAEVTWMVRLLADLGTIEMTPVTLVCDNNSAMHTQIVKNIPLVMKKIAKNPVFHEHTKHIDIDYHFTREKVLEGLLQLAHIPTNEQLADILTKVLPSHQHNYLLFELGMLSPPACRGC
ncbi:transmembrane signal receptor [Lithospermum erythrorhizon]|uniref:Transmembrane signal receptor n=1 Tax=Lithospermum erythrorhizon TaxID=34254 RepID=A0AAV3RW27_LITER